MNDRELLELAAKAAGIDSDSVRFIGDEPGMWFHNDARKHPMCRKPNRPGNVPWNPLDDDGDALRLAVKLNINVYNPPGHTPSASAYFPPLDIVSYFNERDGGDALSATRRAIVRAAASLTGEDRGN